MKTKMGGKKDWSLLRKGVRFWVPVLLLLGNKNEGWVCRENRGFAGGFLELGKYSHIGGDSSVSTKHALLFTS